MAGTADAGADAGAASADANAALFHGRRFYLTRTITPQQREHVRELIEERGGEVTTSLRGSIQLVGAGHLDPRQDWVSVDFVLDSVARGALQDLSDYVGAEITLPPPDRPAAAVGRRLRFKYSAEDDARMLLHLQRDFSERSKSMASVPLSFWTNAARLKITNHSAQSMHERYRKTLRTKTSAERREIISVGVEQAKARGAAIEQSKEQAGEVEQDEEEAKSQEGKEEESSLAAQPRDQPPVQRRTNNAPLSDPNAPPSKRLRRAAAVQEPSIPTTPPARSTRSSSGRSNEEGEGEGEGRVSQQEPSPMRASTSQDQRGEHALFFSTNWATALAEVSHRRRLIDIFESHNASPPSSASERVTGSPAGPASPSTPERQRSPASDATATSQVSRRRSQPDVNASRRASPETAQPEETEPSPSESEILPELVFSTEQELDAQIYRIEFETKASYHVILHTLYYCSGDYATAKAFLKGEIPVGLWSPQEDQLLAELMSASTTRADVEAAARAGAFAAMRVQRSASDIMARIRYLL